MPNTQKPRIDFLVYVIESPSAQDMYHGRFEGPLVGQAAALDQMPSVTRMAVTREAFVAALRVGLPEAMVAYPMRLPLVHISAHGAETGIQLSDGDVVTWEDLRVLLLPVNRSLRGCLILCMSSCKGYSACRMAMTLGTSEHPYWALVANFGAPTWSETAVAYATFYHLVSRGTPFLVAVEAMKAASGNSQWVAESAQQAREDYAQYVANLDLTQAQHQLQAAANAPEVPPGAKALEEGMAG